ncbi:MAG: SpoIIE family protein phosphatase [Acidobacteriota bacterium]|nr:SpoIIE family protein phosphatase [Acidobacteriota bacterium]
MIRELQVLSPDGETKIIPLEGERISVGRSSVAELCYPDDAGLSRQHLTIERDGADWAVRDLGSKNGTLLNGSRISGRSVLKPGDRITAGHLVLIFDHNDDRATRAVVFIEGGDDDEESSSSSTVITNLDRVITGDTTKGADPAIGSAHVNAVLRAGNELAGHRPLPELFRFILDLSIQAVSADRGVLMIVEDDELVVKANKGEGFRISVTVRDRVLKSRTSVLVRNTQLDDAFRERRSIVEQNIRTLMAVPLQTRDRIIGLIYVDSPSLMREFTKDDLSLLTVMANVAAIRIELARLAEIEQAKQVMARDLEQAADIQRSFLPSSAPIVPGLDLAGHNAPCRTVGGDYYEFFTYPNGRVAMVLGDVSGKGMPASLLMMGLQARVQVMIDEPDNLGDVMTRLNRVTAANCPDNKFISFFSCVIDPATGELTYANGGHNPPLIVRADGSYEPLEGGGPVLGILPVAKYEQYKCRLERGDLLAIYSDGVTEAATPDDEEFEIEHLAAVLAKRRQETARTIVASVNEAITAWTAGAPPADDITLIVARRT